MIIINKSYGRMFKGSSVNIFKNITYIKKTVCEENILIVVI